MLLLLHSTGRPQTIRPAHYDKRPTPSATISALFSCHGIWTTCITGHIASGLHCCNQPYEEYVAVLLQDLVDGNRAASFASPILDPGSVPKGTIAQPVAGPSLDQLSSITAALQALQTSMTTMLTHPGANQAGTDSLSLNAISDDPTVS